METGQRGKTLGALVGLVAGLNPAKSPTFLLAFGLSALAAWVWFRGSGEARRPFPVYGVIATSYAGGFLIGMIFRNMLKITAIVATMVLSGFALANCFGVDASKAKQAVAEGSTWAQEKAGRVKGYLMHLLPSGTAAGVGAFAGARRRRSGGEGQPG
jgi:hypothetical protein